MKNHVPTTLNRDAWDNKTINRLEVELERVISIFDNDGFLLPCISIVEQKNGDFAFYVLGSTIKP